MCLKMRLKILIALVSVLTLNLGEIKAESGAETEIKFKNSLSVRGPNISLFDLIDSGVAKAEHDLLKSVSMLSNLQPLSRNIIKANKIRAVLKSLSYKVPEKIPNIRVLRKGKLIEVSKFKRAIQNHFQRKLKEEFRVSLNIEIKNQDALLKVPVKTRLKTQIKESNPKLICGSNMIELGLSDRNGFKIKKSIRIGVSCLQTKVLAKTLIERGRKISSDMLFEEDKLIVSGFLSKSPKIEDVIGFAVKRPVRAGMEVSKDNLDLPPMVFRGKTVRVLARNNFIRISTLGVASDTATMGQIITVKNQRSGRFVQARVVGENLVEVYF